MPIVLDIITNNPFRILGVYANTPKKDIVANQGKMKAFLKVGRAVSFPTDFDRLLPAVSRNEATVADADSKLTLPKERIKYAQFWFIGRTPLDFIAFNHLKNGNIDKAIELWNKTSSLSSLQNRLVAYFIKGDYRNALSIAYQLYEPMEATMPSGLFSVNSMANEFAKTILGDSDASGQGLGESFLKTVSEEIGATKLLQLLPDGQMKNEVAELSISPLIAEIQSAISTAEQTRGQGCTARYNAGVKLMNDTKPLIEQLKQILPQSDTRYQMIADKLGLTILQCGIDYYNESEDWESARNALELQSYALSIVVGRIARNRCKENVDILNDIINKLPPKEVFADAKAIMEELQKYSQLPDTIDHAITLLNNTGPILQRIKTKLGSYNSFYLKISTQVVSNALHNIIEEVNETQNIFNARASENRRSRAHTDYEYLEVWARNNVMKEAWNATQIMDEFDMERDFKTNRYTPNRNTLQKLCEQVGVLIPSHLISPSSSVRINSSSSSSSKKTTSTPSSSSSDDSNWGFVCIMVIIAILAFVLLWICCTN